MAAPATTEPRAPDTRVVPTDDVPWIEPAPGLELKMLRVGGETGTYTLLTRFAPGTVLPKHRHFGQVHAYTIAGSWHYREYDWMAHAGDYVHEPPGSVHTLEVPDDADEAAVILFIVESGLVLLDADGTMVSVEDAQTMNGMYAAVLTMQGVPYPEQVLP